jgi:ATP-dependent Zn protease
VDEEVARIVAARYERVLDTLQAKRSLIEKVAARLLENETIEEGEFQTLVAEG